MHIKRFLLAGLVLAVAVSSTQAGVRIGIGLGIGVPCYGPYYGPAYYGYPYPYPYYYAPPGVVVAPAPVAAAPAVVAGSAPVPAVSAVAAAAPSAPTEQTQAPPLAAPPAPIVRAVSGIDFQSDLSALNDPSVQIRADACIRLGRQKIVRAVPSLTRTLSEDGSPTVREAAARGLGLIASPRALPRPSRDAAQADDDRDVRRSASFAAEVIRGNMRR